ncbi:MAG: Cu(I)/Ag(I) efflux system membrane fusion protein [Crocinitomicaceae bacterium]|jgi:Cu(I)/Ag(I) efflux system membrane fusion protein
MTKKFITPSITAVLGILIGYLIFSLSGPTSAKEPLSNEDQIWTCSMHPQIRKSEPGQCPICGMDLIPLDADSGGDPLIFKMSLDAMKISNIQTTLLGNSENSSGELTLSGKITSDETTLSSIVSHIPGRIEKLYVSFTGDRISTGSRIAKIYSPDLITAQRELLEADKLKDSNPYLLEAAKNKMRYWKISNKEINDILKTKSVKEYFDIYADYSGIVSKKKVSVGDYLNQGEVLFELQNLDKLWAIFDVYESDLNNVKLGDEIEFTTTSLPGKKFTSEVVFIDPIINPKTRTAAIRLKLDNSKKQMKPDMFITGNLKVSNQGIESAKLTVPKTAVLWTGERSVAYVKLQNFEMPTFEFREVLIGESIGDNYIVMEGLYSGDEVVTNGAFVIDASAQLNNRSSMMNRNLLNGQNETFLTPNFSEETPAAFKKQLERVINEYLIITTNLVKSDPSSASLSSDKMISAIQNVDMKLVSDKQHMFWMTEQENLMSVLKLIKNNNDVEQQRDSFDELSNTIIRVAQAYELYEEQYLIQYCPMANDNDGAYWLSKQAQILNPYYGDKMLKCGETKDTIQKKTTQVISKKPNQIHNHNH